jgi:hypothetical protein
MIARSCVSLLFLLLAACDVDSTVGYIEAEGALVGGVPCPADSPLARCSDGPCVVTNLFEPRIGSITLAVDSDSAFFLTDPVAIARRRLDGEESVDLATADSTLMRMTIDDTYVYWTELDGNVRGVPKAGGPRFDVGYVFGNPTDITIDTSHVYWVFPEFGQVAMAPKPAGDATHISSQDAPQAIAVDATHVYWVNGGTASQPSGQLVRAPSGNLASAEVVLSNLDAPIAIAVSDDSVYWASLHDVFRMPKNDSAVVEPVASGLTEIKAIAAFGDTVYGAGMDGLWRAPATGGEPLELERRPMSAMTLTCAGVYASGWFDSAFIRYAP